MQVVALSCPSCGGALPRERSCCEYCGTVTAISSDQSRAISIGVACPKCNATNNENEKHCGQCGAVLLIECPKPGCLQENSIWRKHCKKCGADILESWRVEIEERITEIQDKLARNRSELKQVAADLESAKPREMMAKIFIGGIGAVISLIILSSAGAGGIVVGLIIVVIALIWAANHKSGEKLMLLESASHYLTEIDELEAELKSLGGNKN
jgi:uncharacterized small protein (DUF1192 family)